MVPRLILTICGPLAMHPSSCTLITHRPVRLSFSLSNPAIVITFCFVSPSIGLTQSHLGTSIGIRMQELRDGPRNALVARYAILGSPAITAWHLHRRCVRCGTLCVVHSDVVRTSRPPQGPFTSYRRRE